MHQRFISDQDPALPGFVDATFRITIVFVVVLFCFVFICRSSPFGLKKKDF